MNLTGTFSAIITPFHEDRTLNESALENIIAKQLAANIDGVVVAATTGEAPTLDFEETCRIFHICREIAGDRLHIILGLTSNNTATLLRTASRVQALQPAAIMTAAPYYNKPTQKGLREHFTALADAWDLPIILYNVPSRSGVNIEPETIIELAQDPRFIGVKEASGNLLQVEKVLERAPKTFSVISGNDEQIREIIRRGGRGAISVTSNVLPVEVKALVDAALIGDHKTACMLDQELRGIFDALFIENNPQAVKTVASHLGWCPEVFRLPLTTMLPENKARVLAEWHKTQDILQKRRSRATAQGQRV